MLLSRLTKKEKLKFLDLAIYMLKTEGEDYTPLEKKLLDALTAEVGVDIVEEYSFERRNDVTTTVDYFLESNVYVRRIVFTNLIKCSLVDNLYSTFEHVFLEDIREKFGIDNKIKKDLFKVVYAERDAREAARRIIEQ